MGSNIVSCVRVSRVVVDFVAQVLKGSNCNSRYFVFDARAEKAGHELLLKTLLIPVSAVGTRELSC